MATFQWQTPLELGQTVDLTKKYNDETGFIPDGRGGKVCHVKGWLMHVADLDRKASNHFQRECLTWRLAVASIITNSSIKDVSVQVVQPDSIHALRQRFPGAFDEFERRYGADQLPDRALASGPYYVREELVGKYDGPNSYEDYLETVKGLRKIAPQGKADRLAELKRQIKDLEGEAAEVSATEVPGSDFAPAEGGTPLMTWGAIPQSARVKLMQNGVQTVQDFAAANDTLLETLGSGQWNKWRLKAQDECGSERVAA